MKKNYSEKMLQSFSHSLSYTYTRTSHNNCCSFTLLLLLAVPNMYGLMILFHIVGYVACGMCTCVCMWYVFEEICVEYLVFIFKVGMCLSVYFTLFVCGILCALQFFSLHFCCCFFLQKHWYRTRVCVCVATKGMSNEKNITLNLLIAHTN